MNQPGWIGLKPQYPWNGEKNQVVVCLDELTRERLGYILKSKNISCLLRSVSPDEKTSVHRYISCLIHEQWFKLKKLEKENKKRLEHCKANKMESEMPISHRLEKFKKRKLSSVYLIKDKSSNYTKIGITKNVDQRFRSLLSGNPTIEMLFHHPADCFAERELHKIFREKNVKGEWFELAEVEIETAKFLLTNLCNRITGEFNKDSLYEFLLKENPFKDKSIGSRAGQLAVLK